MSGASTTQDDALKITEQRLLKALDALEKAEALVGFKDKEIAARIALDKLKDEILRVKDLIIAEQDKLIQRLRGNDKGFMARLKKILKTAEKVALIALGVYIAR